MTSKPDNLLIRHEDEAAKEASACGYRYRLLSQGDEDVAIRPLFEKAHNGFHNGHGGEILH